MSRKFAKSLWILWIMSIFETSDTILPRRCLKQMATRAMGHHCALHFLAWNRFFFLLNPQAVQQILPFWSLPGPQIFTPFWSINVKNKSKLYSSVSFFGPSTETFAKKNAMATLLAGGLFATRVPGKGSNLSVGMSISWSWCFRPSKSMFFSDTTAVVYFYGLMVDVCLRHGSSFASMK